MRKISGRSFIVSASALFLAAVISVSSFLIPGIKDIKSVEVDTKESRLYTLDTKDIVYNPNAKREDYKNTFEYIMARDGFVYGCDYDWTSQNLYSDHSLGDNHVNLSGTDVATYNHYQVYTDIYNIKALGFNSVNYWLLSSIQGITFDDDGYAVKVDDNFMDNLRDLLEVCRDVGISILPSLQPHGGASSYGGLNAKGESPIDVWNKYFKFVWHEEAQKKYLDNVIDPICELFAEYQDVIIWVGLTIENSTGWVNDIDLGYAQTGYGTTWENFAKFSNALHDRVKKAAPDLLTACEEAGGNEKLFRYNELKADLLGANYYHSGGYIQKRESYFTERVGYVGEYNVGDQGDFDGEYWGKKRQSMIQSAIDSGWIGCYYFRYTSDVNPCNMFDHSSNTFDYESMFSWAYGFRYVINDSIAKYRKFTPEVEAPSLLANKGGKDVYWIPSRSGTLYDVERSDDGGKTWKTVAKDVDADTSSCANGLIKYTDTQVGDGMTYNYRVTVKTEDGKTATSVPNNREAFYVAEDIMLNGSFETGDYTNWKKSSHNGVITDEEASDGKYSLKYDYSDRENTTVYAGVGQEKDVKMNTTYTCTYDVKCTEAGKFNEPMYVRVRSLTSNKNMVVSYNGGSVTENPNNNDWKTVTITFVTTTDTKVLIDIGMGDNTSKSGVIYVDNFRVKELR